MRAELVVKGRSLTGTSDLTLLAPLIPGLVPSLDSITYRTRTKRLLDLLQGGRSSLHEYSIYRPLSDAVERVAAIHSFRIAVLEPENKVMLAVTFDGTWESYIRVLWQKVGSLLDIIFCNTQDYVNSHDAGFEAWAGWVHRVQVETSFYYSTHGLTVPDVAYLRAEEMIHRNPPGNESQDLLAVQHSVQTAESIGWEASQTTTPGGLETLRQGLQALAVLFRLTDTYLPGTKDGDVLKRASRDLLQEFIPVAYSTRLPPQVAAQMEARFLRQLNWLNSADWDAQARPSPVLPDKAATDMYSVLQAGILKPYEKITHGCLLLIAVDDPAAGALLLDRLMSMVTTEQTRPAPGGLVVNVGVSYEGLRALGLSEEQLAFFPQEFREGMEARASMLGDFRANHPRRWNLPRRNWGAFSDGTRVQMSAVHLAVQLRIGSTSQQFDPAVTDHPLHSTIKQLVNQPDLVTPLDGVRLLHVQAMQRMLNVDGKPVEHFGFADGIKDGDSGSDPVFDSAQRGEVYRNQVQLGEFLLGHDTQSDVAEPPRTEREAEKDEWLRDGSFLVVRKLSQRPDVLHNLLVDASTPQLGRDVLLAKMMGRWQDGRPVVAPHVTNNDFNYEQDAAGAACPFHAHIRRSNPRPPDPDQIVFGPPSLPGGRQPRLMRRGMSYGPPYAWPAPKTQAAPDNQERGLVFMAYNASISEQFEVVQRWITGGNSAGGHSRQSDPFLGVPDIGEQRLYRFEHDGIAQRMRLDAAPAVDEEPQPLVRLEWGIYLFTPSLRALSKLRASAAACRRVAPVWSAEEGEAAVCKLQEIERDQGAQAAKLAWKAALEDPEEQRKFRSAGIWASIRERHGGVLRTPYGVIVADRKLVMQVLRDSSRFTAAGYAERMADSIGEIFLGLDAGDDGRYEAQSKVTDEAISAIDEAEAFALAMAFTKQTLDRFMEGERRVAQARKLPRWQLDLDVKEVSDRVLAMLCQEWFGLPADEKGGVIVPGSWRWDWRDDQPPIYPVQYTAPSRYIFQPWPNDDVQRYGNNMGMALTAAIGRFIGPHRAAGTVPQTVGASPGPARLAKAILGAFPGPENDALTARTFSGALMGMLPTIDGNFRLSLNEWLTDGTFWALRAAWADKGDGESDFQKAQRLLSRPLWQAMQLRPSPEIVWRRSKVDGHELGGVELRTGDVMIVSLVSAAHQCLATGLSDVSMVFGGDRKAPGGQATHACPGRLAGTGVLLGMLSALLSVKETLRPSPVPLAFSFEGQA